MFSQRSLAIIAMFFVSLGYVFMNVASRWMNLALPPMTQVYLRIFGALFLIGFFFRKDISLHKIFTLKPKDWVALTLMGVFGYGLMIYAITQGALLTTLLSVSVLYSTVPFWVYLFGIILFHRPWRWDVIGLITLSIWGVGLLAGRSWLPLPANFGLGERYVLISAIFEAVWFIGIKFIEGKLNSRELTLISLAIAGLTCLTISLFMGESFSLSAFSNWRVVAGLIFGTLSNIWVPFLTVFAFKYLDEVFATQLFLFENIFTFVIGRVFYGEKVGLLALAGATAVISSVYLMNKRQTI